MQHSVKIQMEYYEHIIEGRKRFEVRLNDRDYQVGDTLLLREYNAHTDYCKMGSSRWEIVYVHCGLGMKKGYVVLGIEPLDKSICITKGTK